MKHQRPRTNFVHAVAAAAPVLAAAAPAQALIFHSTPDPAFNTTAPTGALANSGWQYQGMNGGHLGTPVGPHHFLTAAHLNNGTGGTFTYNGVNYTTVASQDFGDLRLFQVDQEFHSYAPLYDVVTDGTETSKEVVVFGRGRTRGSEITLNGALRGWQWGGDDRVQRWGENLVTGIASYNTPGDNMLLKFDFDAAGGGAGAGGGGGGGAGYTGVNEATLAENDSGGAAFINVNGQWKLAGINYAVSSYRTTPDGTDLLAALFDMRGFYDGEGNLITGPSPVPSAWYASRVSASLSSLRSILNLPPTWTNAAGGNWTVNSNWINGTAPNAVDAVADFRTAITGDRTITLNQARTVGTLNFDSLPRYTLGGSNALTLNVSSGSAAINVASGSHTIAAPLSIADPVIFNVIQPSSTLTIGGTLSATGQPLTKHGQGALEVRHLRAASLAVSQGTVRVLPDGTAAGTGKLGTITISPGAKVDLADNALAVTSSPIGSWNGSAYTGVAGLVQSGRAGGSWTGSGIQSSAAAQSNGLAAIGVARAADVLGIAGTQTATWSGQTVDGNAVLLRYTFDGDANLDGKINIDDYGRIDSMVGVPGASGWFNGDFNYDGKINIDDYGIIDSTIGQAQNASLSALAAPSADSVAGVSAVPEPASLALLAGLVPLLARRRRRHPQ